VNATPQSHFQCRFGATTLIVTNERDERASCGKKAVEATQDLREKGVTKNAPKRASGSS